MNIANSIALVTGANGGIGRELVNELLKRNAAKIYVTARNPDTLADLVRAGNGKVVALKLDVTDETAVSAVAKTASDVTLLINNAGYASFQGCISNPSLADARQEMAVNYFGPLSLIRAFAPALKTAGGGAIVNILSFLSLVTLPVVGSYSASKAAGLSLTHSVRAELATQQTLVVAVMPVQVDTAMGASLPEPRLTTLEVATDTLNAVEQSQTEVFPGELTRNAAEAYARDPKALQETLSKNIPG